MVHAVPEALTPPGESWATGDPVVAQGLAQRRVETLLARRQAHRDGRPLEDPRLADFVQTYLTWKKLLPGRTARAERGTPRIAEATLDRDRLCLENLVAFEDDIRLSGVDDQHLRAYIRRRRADGRGERTILHEVHAFSGLWEHAKAERLVQGDNPAATAKAGERVHAPGDEATWLEAGEAARLLDAARAMDADPHARFCSYLHAIVAAFLLTGARKQEEERAIEHPEIEFVPAKRRRLPREDRRRRPHTTRRHCDRPSGSV